LVSLIAILMGLNLLELLPLSFPTLRGTDWITKEIPPGLRSYLLGLTFGLVASPCSTPVLATLLAWVAGTQDLVLGGVMLLAYTLGYVMPGLCYAPNFSRGIYLFLEKNLSIAAMVNLD
ncbi:MAG: hypothetical protein RLZZ148_602, partial [Cyanobacteriota bacterium]